MVLGKVAYLVLFSPVLFCLYTVSQKNTNADFLPHDALCALRGIATVSRPSVHPSVCPSYRDVDTVAI